MLLKKRTKSEGDGWRCPECGRVYGPHVEYCVACNGNMGQPQTPAEKFLDAEALSDFCQEKMAQLTGKMDSVVILAAKGGYAFMAWAGNVYTCRGMNEEMSQALLGGADNDAD